MTHISPTFNFEREILREKGQDLKSMSSSPTDNFSSLMEGLLLSDLSIPVISGDTVTEPTPILEFKDSPTSGDQTEGDVIEKSHTEKGYPLEEKFIFHYLQEGSDFRHSLEQAEAYPVQEERIESAQLLARIKESLINLADDTRIPLQDTKGHENLEETVPELRMEQRVSSYHQEIPGSKLPESLLAKLGINLNTIDLNEETTFIPVTGALLTTLEEQIDQNAFIQPSERPVMDLSGNLLPRQVITPGLTGFTEEDLRGLKGHRFMQINTNSPSKLTESGLTQISPDGRAKDPERNLSADLPKSLTNHSEEGGMRQGHSSSLYEKTGAVVEENPSLEQRIRPGSKRSSGENLTTDFQKNLTIRTEKIFPPDKPDNGGMYHLKDLLPGNKLKLDSGILEEDPWLAHSTKPFRETSEMVINNLISRDHPGSVTNSKALEEKVMEQVVKYVRLNLKEKSSEIEIHLKPELLGSLKIKVAIEGQEIKASFFADTHLAKEIIENHLPSLKQAFLAQNLDIDKFSVFVGFHQGREDIGNNHLKNSCKDKEGHRNKEGRKPLGVQETREPIHMSLNLIDCFI